MSDIEYQPKRKQENLRIGIVGHGFVGKAVDYAFSTPNVDKYIVDPLYKTTLSDLIEFEPQITFICLPTPSKDDGSVDSSLVDEAVMKLINTTQSFIAIKSTITPDVAERLTRYDSRVVYNPEFLTEANPKMDFINQPFNVMGVTDQGAGQYLEGIYNAFSLCNPAQSIMMSPVEASFFKYSVNTYLAMKVTFMNQLKQIADDYGANYNLLSRVLPADQRVGHSHMKIPGPDGKAGFGGSCFPKDLNAFIHFVENKTSVDPTIWKEVREVNNAIRSQYELSDREKSQNVNYGQTKKEQQNKDDGDSKSK
jgi:UDPglucose 6-dehydrogenase